VYFDAPVWSYAGLETKSALFYTLRELVLIVALVVKCAEASEKLFVVGVFFVVRVCGHRTKDRKTRVYGGKDEGVQYWAVNEDKGMGKGNTRTDKRSVLFSGGE
jgi:hypothetical protein